MTLGSKETYESETTLVNSYSASLWAMKCCTGEDQGVKYYLPFFFLFSFFFARGEYR